MTTHIRVRERNLESQSSGPWNGFKGKKVHNVNPMPEKVAHASQHIMHAPYKIVQPWNASVI